MIISIFFLTQIPNWFGGECPGSTKANPFPLPDAYVAAQQRKVCTPNPSEQPDDLISFNS